MGGRVLLIEDEPNIIEAIGFILARDGWQVASHSEGTAAIEAIRREAPDVVILDVNAEAGEKTAAELGARARFAETDVSFH